MTSTRGREFSGPAERNAEVTPYTWLAMTGSAGRKIRVGLLAAAGAAGLVAGHLLDYLIVVRDPAHRHDLLAHTGHGYLPGAAASAAVLAGVAALIAVGIGFRRGVRDTSRPRLAWKLAVAQASGFFGVEIVERLAVGAPLDGIASRLLVLGIALQLLIGALSSLILRALERTGERIARAIRRRRLSLRRAFSHPHPAESAHVESLWFRSPQSIRGPPLPLSA